MSDNLKEMASKMMQEVKIEKPKKNKNECYCWSNAQHVPRMEVSNKHIKDMPDMVPGKTVMMVIECNIKNCNARDDDSKDYELEVKKMGIIE